MEKTLETLGNSLERFQVTQTRQGTKTELGMRQNQRVRERRERWTDGYTQDQQLVRKRTRKGRREQVRFQLCQVISYLPSRPHFWIGVINSRVGKCPLSLCLCLSLGGGGRRRRGTGLPIPADIPGKPQPAPAQDSAPSDPFPF